MRSFFCLTLSDGVKQRLAHAAKPLQGSSAHVRWVRPELMHVTLKFLGEIDPEIITELQTLAEDAAKPITPFEITLDTLGAFPDPERPRVVWAGCATVPSLFLDLHRTLDEGLANLGYRRERQYTPHVTLGRVRDSRPKALQDLGGRLQTPLPPFSVKVEKLTLMESVLRGGPTYIPLFHVKL